MNAKIDYNTANIVFPINTQSGEINVFLPPINREEIKSNALVLGRFAEYTDKINSLVLLTDYDIYIDEIIEYQAENKYNINDPKYKKYIDDSKLKITAMLERSIAAGYYFENNEIKPLNTLDNEAKEMIKKYSKDFDGTLDDKECIILSGISRNSYYKYKRELKENDDGLIVI